MAILSKFHLTLKLTRTKHLVKIIAENVRLLISFIQFHFGNYCENLSPIIDTTGRLEKLVGKKYKFFLIMIALLSRR
jgi:hypothetical protein